MALAGAGSEAMRPKKQMQRRPKTLTEAILMEVGWLRAKETLEVKISATRTFNSQTLFKSLELDSNP